jgi:hypothetical protein
MSTPIVFSHPLLWALLSAQDVLVKYLFRASTLASIFICYEQLVRCACRPANGCLWPLSLLCPWASLDGFFASLESLVVLGVWFSCSQLTGLSFSSFSATPHALTPACRHGQLRSIPPTIGFALVETVGIFITLFAKRRSDNSINKCVWMAKPWEKHKQTGTETETETET